MAEPTGVRVQDPLVALLDVLGAVEVVVTGGADGHHRAALLDLLLIDYRAFTAAVVV